MPLTGSCAHHDPRAGTAPGPLRGKGSDLALALGWGWWACYRDLCYSSWSQAGLQPCGAWGQDCLLGGFCAKHSGQTAWECGLQGMRRTWSHVAHPLNSPQTLGWAPGAALKPHGHRKPVMARAETSGKRTEVGLGPSWQIVKEPLSLRLPG